VRFEASDRASTTPYSILGELVIPVDESQPDDEKPAWLVDGQQRTAAIRDADVAEFPVAAVGFIADGEDEQRSQFILVNNTKPLPRGLIHELLPDTAGHLPAAYARKQLPAQVMTKLNQGPKFWQGHPFASRIAMATQPHGNIKDNSVLKMIENSLYDGALYQYRDPVDGSGDVDAMELHLNEFWKVVESTFYDAWQLEPKKSRLTHGVGIQALGYVMDYLTEGVPAAEIAGLDIDKTLVELMPYCAWTSGTWQFGADHVRKWNGLQNTPADVRLLTSYLLRLIKSTRQEG